MVELYQGGGPTLIWQAVDPEISTFIDQAWAELKESPVMKSIPDLLRYLTVPFQLIEGGKHQVERININQI